MGEEGISSACLAFTFIYHSTLKHLRPFRACWFIAMETGVSSIPVSEVRFLYRLVPYYPYPLSRRAFSSRYTWLTLHLQFYCEEHTALGENYGRFAFCKDVETLKRAGERLQGLKRFMA